MSVGYTAGCPAPVRPGTPCTLCAVCCMCLPLPSLGVQGALVALLLDPLPFSRSMPSAHECSRGLDARPGSLRLKGKGWRPCTPTNPRQSGERLPDSGFKAVRPRRWGEQAGPLHERCVLFCALSGRARNCETSMTRIISSTCITDGCRPERQPARSHPLTSSSLLSGQSRARDGWVFRSFRFLVWRLKSKDGVHAMHVRKNGARLVVGSHPPRVGSMSSPSLCSSFSVSHTWCDPGFVSTSPFFMDDNKKKKKPSAGAEHAADGQTTAKGPIKVFVLEDVSASVFARQFPVRGEERTFYSVSFSRSYRDSNGSRRYVKTFNLEDLGKVIAVAQQADEFIRQQPGVN